jgi:hypothetical protein
MDNRAGLAVDGSLTPASGFAERDQGLLLVARRAAHRRLTLAADKSDDTRDFVDALRGLVVTPHVAQQTTSQRRGSPHHAPFRLSGEPTAAQAH